MIFAMIKNGLHDGFIETTAEHAWEITAAGEHTCIAVETAPENGSTYDAATGVFTPPAQPEIPPPVRHISVGALFDRFGPLKWAVLASTDPTVKALIADCSVRRYIDLDNPDLPAGLDLVVAAGYAVDPEAILTAAILPKELP